MWSVCVFVVGVRVCVYGFFFLFCFESVISIPLHAARRAMAAAACRCLSQARNSSLFPPQVYPFPTPEPACAVIVGVSQRLLLPISAKKHYRKQKKRVKQLHHPHKRKETKGTGEHACPLLLHSLVLLASCLLHLDLWYVLLIDARGPVARNLHPLFPSWWGRGPPPPGCMLGDPLGHAGISPCAMRTSTVCALCRSV